MSFRLKTILGIATIEALLLTLLIGGVLNYLHDSNERQLRDRALTTSTLFASIAQDAVISSDLGSLESFVDEIMNNPDLVYARVIDADGRILAQQGRAMALSRPFVADLDVESVNDDVFDVQAPIAVAGIVYGLVEVGLDVHALLETQKEARRHSLLIAGVEMALVALFSFILGLYLTRQLGALTKASHAVAEGKLGYQVPVHGKDELAETALAFNRMSRQLEADAARRDAVLRSALDCIIMVDGQGSIVEFNPAAEATFGYLREEIIGRDLLDTLIPDAYQAAIATDMRKLGETDAGYRCESFVRHADTRVFPVELAIAVVKIAGAPLFTIYLRDITARRETEERLRNLYRAVEQSPASVVITGLDGTIEFVNSKFVEVTGYSRVEAIGENPRLLKSGKVSPEVYAGLWSSISSGREWQGELLNRKKNGELYWEWVSITPVRTDGGILTHYVAVKEEITERKAAEDKLKLAASVFTHSREGIGITDASGAIIEVNDAFTRITGYRRDELIGNNPRMLKSGRHGAAFYAALWHDLLDKGFWHGEVWNRRKNRDLFAAMLTISAVGDKLGQTQHYVALYSDITKQKEYQHQLEYIAHYDALTNLPNRVLMADRLHQAMAHSQRRGQGLAVVYLDLDGFKTINDVHGHDYGDQLLTSIAHRMQHALRDGDTIARLGGDEFVAVLTDLEEDSTVTEALKRLLSATAQPVHIGDHDLQVSASLGVTFYPQDEEVDADMLLRQADQAMYQAKLSGKNRYHIFDAAHDRSVRGQHEILERFRQALTADELVLHFQPKVNMHSGEVIGVEALVRWQHPERGLLPPSEFLPLIESHALSTALGEWVIEAVLTQIETWQAGGLAIPVSVNIAGHQLQQADFIQRLQLLLASHPEVSPNRLELELLETSALENMVHVSRVMEECREIGVHFAIDDFGTGYSSLTYLKRLPATQLKIDRSFVRDMLEDPDDLAILEGVLGLATAFRHQVVAEGVETVEHGVMLLQLGCEVGQGYTIARPMPADEVPAWVASWQPDPRWSQQRRLSRDNQPLLFAGVEHRAWIRAIHDFLEGDRLAPPPMDHGQCRFGQWLKGDAQQYYAENPALKEIEVIHVQVHELAIQLLKRQAQGHHAEAREKLDELLVLRDKLLGLLGLLLKEYRR